MLSVRMRLKGFKCESNMRDMSWGLTSSKHQSHNGRQEGQKVHLENTFKKKHGSNGSFHDLFLFSYFFGEALLRWTCATRTIPAARCGDDGGFFSAYVQMPAIINGQFSCSCLCFLCLCIGVCMILYWLNAQASQALDSFVFGVISFSHTGDGARL